MSVQSKTRVKPSTRWIRAAVAAFVLASSASLLAQNDEKDRKKEPPPPHQKNTPPAKGAEPASHTSTPPANNPEVHPGNTTPPRQNDRPPAANRNVTPPAGNAPGRQFGNGGNPNAERTPAGTSGRSAPPSAERAPAGNRPVYRGANGSEVHYRSNGQPQVVKARGMTITHTPSGVRQAMAVRPDHSVIVTEGAHHGYVQRNYMVNNRTYVQRTYVVGGVSYARVYRPYMYHGISLNLYVSSRYYPPAYYGWAYSPWATPVVFSWGWGGSPWYGFYGGYFTPYPRYASAAFWLTDYMIAMTLQEAYQERMDAAAQAGAQYGAYGSQAALTPEVKQAIADEVSRQLQEERAASQSMAPGQGAPEFLADNSTHVFVVANGLDVPSRWGECALTEGDVLQMTAPPPPNSATADLAVLASKGQDCRKGSVVSIAIPDLQDMQNHMRETLDQGLADLQTRQGQGGIPMPPAAAQGAPVEAPYAAAAPPPDPSAASDVSQQAQQATQAEGEVLDQAQAAPPAASAPTSVTLGMTIDQVVGILGQPQVVGDLGSKKTYFYGNMKVIFTDGKVTDVQ